MTMVHVSRTLRRLREERLLIVARQVVIISDIEGVREVAKGVRPLPTAALERGPTIRFPLRNTHPAGVSHTISAASNVCRLNGLAHRGQLA